MTADTIILECALCEADLGIAQPGQIIANVIGPHLTHSHAYTAYKVADLNYFTTRDRYDILDNSGSPVIRGLWQDGPPQ